MSNKKQIQLFNSPLETGVRSLVLLGSIYPYAADLSQLVCFDYLVLHSEDFGGPMSLHPPVPLRSGEILVKRRFIEQGLNLMILRGLVEHKLGKDGIKYIATDNAHPFIVAHQTNYINSLRERAAWVSENYARKSAEELNHMVKKVFDYWTMEFENIQENTII